MPQSSAPAGVLVEAVLGTGGVAAALVEPSPMLESPKLPQSAPAPADEARVGGDGSGAPDTMASKAPHLLSSLLISETTGLPSSAPATSPVFSELPQSSLLAAVGAACGVAAGMAGAGTAAAGARAEAGGARDGVGTGVAATEPTPKLPQSSLPAPAEGVLSSATAAGARVGGDGSGAPDIIASKAPHLLSSPLISGASSFSTTISDAAVSVGKDATAWLRLLFSCPLPTPALEVGGGALIGGTTAGTPSLLASPKLPQCPPSSVSA